MSNSRLTRRQFFGTTGTILGGAAALAANPQWVFASVPGGEIVTRTTWSMGTVVNLSLATEAAAADLFKGSFDALYRVGRGLSAHNPESELGHLNDWSESWRKASPDLIRVARESVNLGELSDGALDVTVLPMLRCLGIMPPGDVRRRPARRPDFTQLRVAGDRVRIHTSGYEVDFGGIAKGYAADQAIEALTRHGVRSALLEAGGDIVALGRPAPERRWRVGIRDPHSPSEICAHIDLEDEAIATSGIYEQPAKTGPAHHIVDPRTGQPATHVLSATIVAPSAMRADGLATALSVMSPAAGQHLVQTQAGIEAYLIYSTGDTFVSRGLDRRLTLL